MTNTSERLATPAGRTTALATLTVLGGVGGLGYVMDVAPSLSATQQAVFHAVSIAGLLATAAVLVLLALAVARRTLRPGWLLGVVPLFGLGWLVGMVAGPLATGDLESTVWFSLFLMWPAAAFAGWLAIWATAMTVAKTRRTRTIQPACPA